MFPLSRCLGLYSQKSNTFYWKDIVFHVTQFGQNDKQTRISGSTQGCMYTTTLNASQGTTLRFKVRNGCFEAARILLRIQSRNRTIYKTIMLNNNSYKELACISCDCSMEIMHIGLDDEIHDQELDSFFFHVIGIDHFPVCLSNVHCNNMQIYHPNKKPLSWGVIDFCLAEYDQNGKQHYQSDQYISRDLKTSVNVLTNNAVAVAAINNCAIKFRIVLKKTEIFDQTTTYQTKILQPDECRDLFKIRMDTNVQVMHISTQDGVFTKHEQPDLLFNFTGLETSKNRQRPNHSPSIQ